MFEHMAKYIDRLNTAAEDRLLTTKLVPYKITAEDKTAGCIIGVATGAFKEDDCIRVFSKHKMSPEALGFPSYETVIEFNTACVRDPVATAEFIRNRILENRATKALVGVVGAAKYAER